MATAHEREEILNNADVGAIGSHCSLDTCNRLDFLPFVCESCNGCFCLAHRTESAHNCKKAGAWLSSFQPSVSASTTPRNPRNLLASPCAANKCKTVINTPNHPGVNCPQCRKQYCLQHRLSDNHECRPPPPPAATIAQEKAKSALSKFKAWSTSVGKEKGGGGGGGMLAGLAARRPGATSGAVAVLKMKKDAKGDERIPIEKRVYLFVEAEARTTTSKLPRGTFWYSKDWSVGRVLDVAAKGLQVSNLNNQGDSEEKRLRVFHIEGGRVLSFSEKIGDVAVNGNTIVLIRGLQMPELLE